MNMKVIFESNDRSSKGMCEIQVILYAVLLILLSACSPDSALQSKSILGLWKVTDNTIQDSSDYLYFGIYDTIIQMYHPIVAYLPSDYFFLEGNDTLYIHKANNLSDTLALGALRLITDDSFHVERSSRHLIFDRTTRLEFREREGEEWIE